MSAAPPPGCVPTFGMHKEQLQPNWAACLSLVRLTRDGIWTASSDSSSFGAAELETLRAAVIFGERRSGCLVALRWIRDHLPASVTGALVDGPDVPITWNPGAEEHASQELKEALRKLQEGDVAAACAELKTLCTPGAAKPLVLLVRFYEAPDQLKDYRKLVYGLRGLWEAFPDRRVRLVVATSWWDLVIDTIEESGLISIGDCYRVAPWGEDAVGAAARALLPPEGISVATAARVAEATGGQPLLVELALRDMAALGESADLEDGAESALESLRQGPPEIVGIWQQQLEALVKTDPELALRLQRYVEGYRLVRPRGTPWPALRADLPLYVSGWLGFDARGDWGIRSPLHRTWARAILVGGRHGR